MCSNYRPVTSMDRMLTFFGVEREKDEIPRDIFPLSLAPFIRLSTEGQEGGKPALVAEDGEFGLNPGSWAKLEYGRKTYNARAETVDQKISFKGAWFKAQRCIIPAEGIYEPNYETGQAVRWLIQQAGSVPMGIAGIYSRWRKPDGGEFLSFAMITVNADDHPFMKRFQKPGEEKRMVVILDPKDYFGWLTVPVHEAKKYLQQWHGHLEGFPAPLARAPKSAPLPPPQDELF